MDDRHHDLDRRHLDRDCDHDRDPSRSFVKNQLGGSEDAKSDDGGSKHPGVVARSLQQFDDYGRSFVDALRKERLKIQSFRRELPLCMHLLDTAIQYSEDRDPYGGRLSPSPLRLGCVPDATFEEKHQQKPILKEFLSLKPKSAHDSFRSFTNLTREDDLSTKAVYMHSLENNNMQLHMNGDSERCESRSSSDEYTLIKADQDEKGKVDGMEANSRNTPVRRKTRRSWSPDLHQRFLNALQQLGGAQVATPKQIRELMNVDGLTNDEVKSHLQKFRLHMRRPAFTMSPYNHSQRATTIHDHHHRHQGPNQKAHLVLFGGIWVPSSSDILFTNLESDLITSGRSSSQTPICTKNY